eukprot:6826143-Ditylum_brightwellii.AAC.1
MVLYVRDIKFGCCQIRIIPMSGSSLLNLVQVPYNGKTGGLASNLPHSMPVEGGARALSKRGFGFRLW